MFKSANKQILMLLVASSIFISIPAHAENQMVAPSQTQFTVSQDDSIEFTLAYPASNPANTTGLGVQLYYDSNKITLQAVTEVFEKDLIAKTSNINDTNNSDENKLTNKKINIAWASLNGSWPATEVKNTQLFKVSFKPTTVFKSTTTIGFTGNASAGNTFVAKEITIISDRATKSTTDTTPDTEKDSATDTNLSSKSSGGAMAWLMLIFAGFGFARRFQK